MKTLNYLHLDASAVQGVVASLKQLLADYQIFYSNLRGLHWNIRGRGFFVLHAKFEELYNDAAAKADEVAERILTLGDTPENRYSEYVREARLDEVSGISRPDDAVTLVLDSYARLIGAERALMVQASRAGDETTAALMSDYLKEQEKLVWMLTASLDRSGER